MKIIKIGGNIIDNPIILEKVLDDFSKLSTPKILIHGGGKIATEIAQKINIPTQMVNGRRITDQAMLKIVTMTYAGLINKNIVATLQKFNCNALGLSGADANSIKTIKRPIKNNLDYGFVGDFQEDSINGEFIYGLINQGITPVFSAITHNGKGQLLNTNADTIATESAITLGKYTDVELIFCFEKKGVLMNLADENSYIPSLNYKHYQQLKEKQIIHSGMLPKLENAFYALKRGVKQVVLCNHENIVHPQEKTTIWL